MCIRDSFIINIGAAAYRNDGSSIATDVSNVDSQGTAYKIYACGILYGAGRGDDLHNDEIEILIPLENIVVMPTWYYEKKYIIKPKQKFDPYRIR